MDDYFILIYEGVDEKLKFRILVKNAISSEKEYSSVDCFKKTKIIPPHTDSAFYALQPLGGTFNNLDFHTFIFHGVLHTSAETPAWEFFKDIQSNDASKIFEILTVRILDDAWIEKQNSPVH